MVPGQRNRAGTRTPPSKVVPLPSRRWPDAAGDVLMGQPGAVVAGEDQESVAFEAQLFEDRAQPAHAVVHLGHDVAVGATRALALEVVVGEEGDVGGVVREVEEEGLLRVGPDELDRALDVAPGEGLLPGGTLDDLAAAQDGDVEGVGLGVPDEGVLLRAVAEGGVHVVRVGDPEVEVEAVVLGLVLGEVAEVPLAHHRRGVPAGLEKLGDGDLGRGEAAGGVGEEDRAGLTGHAAPHGQAAGEEARAAGRAVGRAGVEGGPALALPCHAVEVWCLDGGVAVGGQVPPAHVVGHDQDDVGGCGAWCRRGRGRAREACDPQEQRDQRAIHAADTTPAARRASRALTCRIAQQRCHPAQGTARMLTSVSPISPVPFE